MSTGSLIAARHADAAHAGICYGHSEIAVTLEAKQAALFIAKAVSPGLGIDCVWTSSLLRCLQLARVLAKRFEAELRVDERVRELDFGKWEGKSWAAIEKEQPEVFVAWANDWRTVSPPGGETADQLVQRVSAWWRELETDRQHLLVAHAGAIRALRVIASGWSWQRAMQTRVEHLAPERFELRNR